MIIACEKCNTRFQLDDARIPVEGVKVRCSKCKHAFFVGRPQLEAASDEQAAEGLAAEVYGEEPTQALDGNVDDERTELLDRGGEGFGNVDLGPAGSPGSEEGDEESDWQFNEEPEPSEAGPEPTLDSAEPEPAQDPMQELFGGDESAADDESLENVGNPEDWNLLGEDAEADAEVPAPVASVEPEPAVEPAPAETVSDGSAVPRQPARPATEAPVSLDRDAFELPGVSGPTARAIEWATWAVVALLVVATARAALVPRVPHADASRAPVSVAGLRADGVHGRIVENAASGPLLVVFATLSNPHDQPRLLQGPLRVQLLDASGQRIPGAEAQLARAPSRAELRGQPAEWLVRRLAGHAHQLVELPFAPGEAVEAAAVFPAPPEAARSFRLDVAGSAQSE